MSVCKHSIWIARVLRVFTIYIRKYWHALSEGRSVHTLYTVTQLLGLAVSTILGEPHARLGYRCNWLEWRNRLIRTRITVILRSTVSNWQGNACRQRILQTWTNDSGRRNVVTHEALTPQCDRMQHHSVHVESSISKLFFGLQNHLTVFIDFIKLHWN